jgi:hypothetical protein
LPTDARVGFVKTSYTVNEIDGSLDVAVQVFNPPATEDLTFPITLVYETRTGTAGKCINLSNMCYHN